VTQKRKCRWPTCEVEVHPKFWGCEKHWFMLPKLIRDRINRYYRKGQERDLKLSAGYLIAEKEAQDYARKVIAEGIGKAP
jgi:hypothetical protein